MISVRQKDLFADLVTFVEVHSDRRLMNVTIDKNGTILLYCNFFDNFDVKRILGLIGSRTFRLVHYEQTGVKSACFCILDEDLDVD